MPALLDHFATLRHLHIGFVAASGMLFAVRAFALLRGATWPLTKPARVASWAIDSALLSAGALLWAALQIHPLVQTWLAAKLLWLLVYIGLGTMALRRARTPGAHLGWTLAALVCLGWIAATAVAHDPRGPLRWLLT